MTEDPEVPIVTIVEKKDILLEIVKNPLKEEKTWWEEEETPEWEETEEDPENLLSVTTANKKDIWLKTVKTLKLKEDLTTIEETIDIEEMTEETIEEETTEEEETEDTIPGTEEEEILEETINVMLVEKMDILPETVKTKINWNAINVEELDISPKIVEEDQTPDLVLPVLHLEDLKVEVLPVVLADLDLDPDPVENLNLVLEAVPVLEADEGDEMKCSFKKK